MWIMSIFLAKCKAQLYYIEDLKILFVLSLKKAYFANLQATIEDRYMIEDYLKTGDFNKEISDKELMPWQWKTQVEIEEFI